MADFATCLDVSCNTRVTGRAAACPVCAGPMRNDGASKVRGGLLAGLGLFLVAFMAWIGASMLPAMMPDGMRPGDGPSFTGTADQGRTILALFAAIMVFAATATGYGAYMVVTGRQNRLFMLASLILFGALAYYGWTIARWDG
jgi:hypothetical protein